MSAVVVTGLTRAIGGVPIVADVTFAVPAGERLALVGPSGSGKTTILRLLGGFDRADAGRIAVGGRPLTAPGLHVPPRLRRVGSVPQEGALFPHLTAAGNLGFGVPRAARRARVPEVAALVGVGEELLGRYPHELSGGQQQRVALGRALATRPDVVLLDEPFSALDTGLRAATREAVVAVLERSGTTTILVTHDQSEALRFGQGIGVVEAGRLVQVGEPAAVFDAPATLSVFRFLGASAELAATREGDVARTVLGPVAVGADRSGGATATVAAVRPGRIAVARGGDPTAMVAERIDDGDRVRLVLAAGEERIPAELDRVDGAGLLPGTPVRAWVRGTANLYPAAARDAG